MQDKYPLLEKSFDRVYKHVTGNKRGYDLFRVLKMLLMKFNFKKPTQVGLGGIFVTERKMPWKNKKRIRWMGTLRLVVGFTDTVGM